MGINVDNARAAWGDNLPPEILVLAEECDRDGASQARIGTRINYSGSVVNAVLKAVYRGDLTAVKTAIRGRFMAETVDCPELGSIPSNVCHGWQRKKLNSANTINVRLYRACRAGCPHSRIGGHNG